MERLGVFVQIVEQVLVAGGWVVARELVVHDEWAPTAYILAVLEF